MADAGTHVEVRGLRDLSKAFGQMDTGLRQELKSRMKAVAESVVRVAQGKIARRSGKAASSIKARAGLSGSASIAFGGTKAPYMPWLDFGGSTGRGHVPGVAWSGAIKRDWRGNPFGEGRYIYPSIRQERPEIERTVEEAIKLVAQRAGFETR